MDRNYRAIIVGGNFDEAVGKASKLVGVIADATGWQVVNGGNLSVLRQIDFKNYDVMVWMPNVDNKEEKLLPNIKAINPRLTLISSKRVVEKSYGLFDVISRLLKSKSNLGIMIERVDGLYNFKLVDPLGNQYCDTTSATELGTALRMRVDEMRSLTRIASKSLGALTEVVGPVDDAFVRLVRDFGDEFSRHVNAVNPERFLGNASARPTDRITQCCHGIPAFRDAGHILVSRRNVNKTTLSADDFVVVAPDEDQVRYFGEVKPSVDSPIQIRLFKHFPYVNYIIHGHAYLKDAPMTASKIPCGHVEEFDEIRHLFSWEAFNFGVNLKGHGCLILGGDLGYMRSQMGNLVGRPFPEA